MSKSYSIQIKSVRWIEFSHGDIPHIYYNNISRDDFEFLLNANISVNKDSEEVLISINTKILFKGESTTIENIEVLSSLYSFLFHVKDLESNSTDDLNGDLARELLNISYATNRGIICARTEGTILSMFPLPVIDPSTLLS